MNAKEDLKRILSKAKCKETLGPVESEQILRLYSIPLVRQGLASTASEAVAMAEKIGYPIVLKIVSPDISHKSDIGGVKLNITNREDLERAYREVTRKVREHKPDVRISGVLVQKMVEDKNRIEAIVGMKRDPTFGPVILFGLGGIFVELLKDVSLAMVPMIRDDALRMIKKIKGYPLLDGYRGGPRYDIESIVDIILKMSELSKDAEDISEMDLNPVLAMEKRSIVVDARIVTGAQTNRNDLLQEVFV